MRHLLFVAVTFFCGHTEHASVNPVAHERYLARQALGLGDFVLMVREDQVGAAAMNVNLLAQRLFCHRRAFDVPARTPLAPGTFPPRFARLGGLPEREVARD